MNEVSREWYVDQIDSMLQYIDSEQMLRRIYLVIRTICGNEMRQENEQRRRND